MEPNAISHVFLARQPIVNRAREVVGYELLFRGSATATTAVIQGDGTSATASLLANSVLTEGVTALTGGVNAWLNMTEDLILSDAATLLSPRQCVLEILETVHPTADVLARCQALRAAGFKLALDDIVCVERLGEFRGCFDFVKVDWRAAAHSDIEEVAREGKRLGVTLLAEKVETDEDIDQAIAGGFQLLQGYAIGRPQGMERTTLRSFGPQTVRLLELASAETIEYAKVEGVVGADPALMYKVLAFARSGAAAQSSRVTTLRQALVLFGERNLRHTALLVFLAQTAGSAPSFALIEALVAGLFCEALASAAKRPDLANGCMLAGTLSHMDRLLGLSIEEVVERLPVDRSLGEALVGRRGALGQFVQLARSFQEGDWLATDAAAGELGLRHELLEPLYQQAVLKAEALISRDERAA